MLFCLIRKKKVVNTPEERVRQKCLGWMINDLGYPPGLIAIEKGLNELPHLIEQSLPNRRLDILVYRLGNPLLLIECKAEVLNSRAESQVIGYAHLIGAPIVALISPTQVKTAFLTNQLPTFLDGLPAYQDLISAL